MEVLSIMCERCAGHELTGKAQSVFEYITSMGLQFWGCPHLTIILKEILNANTKDR